MPSENLLDIDRILAPISDDKPSGSDCRENPSPTSNYQVVRSARAAARAAERQSLHDGNSTAADEHWRKIIELAPSIIAEKSKDLEVSCWLAEAMIRKSGFQGLRDSFAIINGLVEHYWEELYPMPDEDGMETRVACLSGLNGEGAEGVLIAPIRKVPITEGDEYPAPFSLWQYQQAVEAQKAPDEEARERKIEKLGFGLDTIRNAVDKSSSEFFVSSRDKLHECITLYKKTSQILDEKCGAYDAPPTRLVIETLEECLGVINHLGKGKIPEPESTSQEQAEESNANISAADSASTRLRSGMMTRDSAFEQLIEISDFFRKTEPHSPLSYMLQKAVRWGKMPLPELMNELIPDSSSRDHFENLTGVGHENE